MDVITFPYPKSNIDLAKLVKGASDLLYAPIHRWPYVQLFGR